MNTGGGWSTTSLHGIMNTEGVGSTTSYME